MTDTRDNLYSRDDLCNFSHAGTYGHECGAPATLAARLPSQTGTKTGFYWVRRCAKCAAIKGGENRGILEFVPYNPEVHKNEWR